MLAQEGGTKVLKNIDVKDLDANAAGVKDEEKRKQLRGIVDEKDFDIEELRMLGIGGEGEDMDGTGFAAAFESIFDDDIAAEESKASEMRHHKTAQLFAASGGFTPLNGLPRTTNQQASAEGSTECKDESLEDMLDEQRMHLE